MTGRARALAVAAALELTGACSGAEDPPPPAPKQPSPAREHAATEKPSAAPRPAPQSAADDPASETEIRLLVGSELRERLVPVEVETYARGEMAPLFTRLREASGPYCRDKHGIEAADRAAVEAFVKPASWFLQAGLGEKWTVVAGCWNFVWMNDRRPQRDFEVARWMVPSEHGYRCYAVGVMQPYIMSEVLDCTELTMIDFDWQIHAVHQQIVEAWREGGLADDALDQTLTGFRVDWIAHHDPQEEHEVSLASFCHRAHEDRCRETFAAFDGRREDPNLRSVTLQLAGLHEIELGDPKEDRGVPIVFLSNATEKHFLRHKEFLALLERMESTLLPGQRGLFVHHVGNDRAFGLYQLLRTESGSELSVLCRDEYRRGRGKSEVYETWFEHELQRPGRPDPEPPPECKSLRTDGPPPPIDDE